jgi:fructuronate reductase
VRLDRRTWPAGPPWPVRAVHLGPGAFFRAHQAWCTSLAGDGWGIAAVGRSAASTSALVVQDGLCTALVRGPAGDDVRVLGAVSTAATLQGLSALLREPTVGVVTLTITEAGYAEGSLVPAALAAALEERLAATGGAPIAVVSCDNLAGNGRVLAERVLAVAPVLTGPATSGELTFPSTVVDRITPAVTAADLAAVEAALGLEDRAAVVTEPTLEWVLEDAFPGGRPQWERAGARLVDDVAPWSVRKLRVLNAGHSLLAYAGGARGHRWVHEAIADPELLDAVRGLWSEAVAWMPPAASALVDGPYLGHLLDRWANARLPHALAQIAADGSAKLVERVAPTLRSGGASCPWSAAVVGAWVAHLRGATPFEARDVGTGTATAVAGVATLDGAARAALDALDPALDAIGGLRTAVAAAAARYLSR